MMNRFEILNRLKIWQKLAVVAAAFMLPLALTTYFLLDEKDIKIDFAHSELAGDEYLRPTARLLEHVSLHRALLRLQKSEAGRDVERRIADVTGQVDKDLLDVEAVDKKLGGLLQTGAEEMRARRRESAMPSALRQSWDRARGAAGDAADAAHDKLINDVRTLITHVGDSSKLILDPDLDTYYQMDALLLREPEAIDRLYRLGDRATDIATHETIPPAERIELNEAKTLLAFHQSNIETDAQTTIQEMPNFSKHQNIGRALEGPLADTRRTTTAVVDVIDRLIAGEHAGAEPARIRSVIAAAVVAHARNWQVLIDEEDTMLGIRMKGDLGRRSVALWSVVGSVLLTLLLTVLVLRSITRPIARAVVVADELARGELPEKIEVGNATDETATLLRSINGMLQFLDLRRTIGNLKESAGMLAGALGEIEAQASQQEEAAMRQSTALQQTQVTTHEIRQTSRVAAEKAAAVLQVAERAETVGRSGEAAIEKSVGGLGDIRQQAESIAVKIGELNQRTQQIGVITQTVKDLADQSNMLALNAAIEAVRSGEHGKGFSVVAREIRNLADQSIQATNRVNEILEAITASIREVVTMADSGRNRVEAGVLEVRTSGDSLKELSAIVREGSQSARQIAAAVSQQDAGIGQIFGAISDQTRLMEETVKRLEGSKAAVGTLRGAAERVSEVVARFNV